MFFFALQALLSLGLRPGLFWEMFLFTLRVLFSLGLRPELFRPPGILPPAGNFLLAQKVPQKRLPPVALRGFPHHFRPPPVLPSTRLHRGGPGWLSAETRSASTVPFEAASKHTPHLQPSWSFPPPHPPARVAGRWTKTWRVSALLSAFNLVSSETFLFTLRVLFSLGLRPGLFCPPGILPPAGNFLLAQKVPQKRLPPVALRGLPHHFRPPPELPSTRLHRGGRGGSVLKREALQPCHLKPPRNIRLTCNPLGAIRNSLEEHPSLATLLGLSSPVSISEGRGATCKMWRVSALLSVFNLVSSTRGFQIAHMPTLHYLMSIHELTESNVKLTLQRPYIAAC